MTDQIQIDAPGGAEPTTNAEELSLRDQLIAARNEVSGRAEPPTEAVEAQEPAPGQPRTPDGKFAPKAGESEPQTPAVETPPIDPQPEVKVPAAVPEKLKDKFLSADPELRAWLESREADVHKQFTRNDEERNFGKQLKDVITPYMPLIQAEGGNPVAAVQSLLNTAYVLRTASPEQKQQLLRQLAQQFNIPVDGLASPQPFVDPALETLQQRLDRLERERQAEVQTRQQQHDAAVQTEIEAFKSQPGREHFEQVRDHMAALLSQGLAKDLDDAYDQAVWARPDLRSTLLSQREREAEQQRAEAARQRAEAAKRASGSVVGGPGATSPAAPNPNRSLRDELKVQLAAANGRV